MHVLIPSFPRGEERQHDQRRSHRAKILAARLPRIPLGQGEHLEEEDTKEEEQDEPQAQQAENDGQARSAKQVNGAKRQRWGHLHSSLE